VIPGLGTVSRFTSAALAVPVTWTFTTSHGPYAGSVSPTQANMSDGVTTTYYAADTAVASWVEANFGSPVFVSSARLADAAGNNAWNASYLNSAQLEYWDGGAWQGITTAAGHLSTGNLVTYSVNLTTQRVRVRMPSTWIALSEFWFT
jgi:hypothetical protein